MAGPPEQTGPSGPERCTRRELARRAAGAALLPTLAGAADALARDEGDAALLSGAIERERASLIAHRVAARRLARDDPAAAAAARLLARQDAEHVATLVAKLGRLGVRPPSGPQEVAGLAGAHGRRALLRLALELEQRAVAGYHDALGRLRDPALLRTAASVMASDGQHLVVVRGLLGEDPLAGAFEIGSPSRRVQ